MQGASLPGRIEDFLEGIPRAREEEDAIFVLLLVPPRLPVRGNGQLARLSTWTHDNESGLFLLDLNFIGRGEDLDDLVTIAEQSGKVGL